MAFDGPIDALIASELLKQIAQNGYRVVVSVDGINGTASARDAGPSWVPAQKHTASADLTTAAAITLAPDTGQRVVIDDLIVSSAVATTLTLQMENTADVLAVLSIPASSVTQITPRDGFRADVAGARI